jgi:hypothetical protein
VQTLLSSLSNPPLRLSRFVSSVVVHVALLSTAVALSRFVISQTDELDWSRFRVEPLRLHESTPIFFLPDSDRAPVSAALSLAPHGAGRSGPTVLEPYYRP